MAHREQEDVHERDQRQSCVAGTSQQLYTFERFLDATSAHTQNKTHLPGETNLAFCTPSKFEHTFSCSDLKIPPQCDTVRIVPFPSSDHAKFNIFPRNTLLLTISIFTTLPCLCSPGDIQK
mmetsp:Transcript_830/g.2845  ORF Transcript_830/g.2845 Transcript_830/m.2845 type:complete len:121 (+) Transcript_830:696-1058(+)